MEPRRKIDLRGMKVGKGVQPASGAGPKPPMKKRPPFIRTEDSEKEETKTNSGENSK